MGSDEYTRDLDPFSSASDEWVKDMEGNYIYPLTNENWEDTEEEDEE